MSLSSKILLSLVLGVGAGLFFGEPIGAPGVVGDAFVRLLQMTVLPYVMVSAFGNHQAAPRRFG